MSENLTQKIFDYALKTFLVVGTLFTVPISKSLPQEQITAFGYITQELFFRYGTVALYFLSMLITPKRKSSLFIASIFGLFVLMSSLHYGFDLMLRAKMLNVFFGVLFLNIVYENFDFSKIKSYAWWFGWLLLINFGLCALQYNGFDSIFNQVGVIKENRLDMIVGFLRVKVHLGTLVVILAPMVLALAPVFSLCLIPLLWFSKSSSAILAISAALAVMLSKKIKRAHFLIAMAVIILAGGLYIYYYDMPDGQFTERFKVWNGAIGYAFRTNPWIGNGIGSFARANFATSQATAAPLSWIWAHNEFVQAFFEFGAIGLAIILSMLVCGYKDFLRFQSDPILSILFASCLSIVIISFFNFPFHLGRFSHLCLFFIALFHARTYDLKEIK